MPWHVKLGEGSKIPRELGSYFLGDVFLSRQGGCDTILIFQESSSNFILIFIRIKGVHAKNLGPGQLG